MLIIVCVFICLFVSLFVCASLGALPRIDNRGRFYTNAVARCLLVSDLSFGKVINQSP